MIKPYRFPCDDVSFVTIHEADPRSKHGTREIIVCLPNPKSQVSPAPEITAEITTEPTQAGHYLFVGMTAVSFILGAAFYCLLTGFAAGAAVASTIIAGSVSAFYAERELREYEEASSRFDAINEPWDTMI